MSSLSDSEYEIEDILGERQYARKGKQYLVRWRGMGSEADSWEPLKNLSKAKNLIADFLAKKKASPKKKSTSRSRSRSRGRKSRSRSTSRSRSGSRSRKPATQKAKKVTKVKEVKTETIQQSPEQVQQKTETVTTTVSSPNSQKVTTYSKTTERISSSAPLYSAAPVPSVAPVASVQTEKTGFLQRVKQCVCAPVCQAWNCCCGCVTGCCDSLKGSDYPAIIVFITITVIVLSFVLQEYVNFEELWKSIVALFMGVKDKLVSLAPQTQDL